MIEIGALYHYTLQNAALLGVDTTRLNVHSYMLLQEKASAKEKRERDIERERGAGVSAHFRRSPLSESMEQRTTTKHLHMG